MMGGVFRVIIVGASGFTGAELLRLCAAHPLFEVAAATGDSMAGRRVADLYPSLAAAYPDAEFVRYAPDLAEGCDLAFCALPHGASQAVVGGLREAEVRIVDLSADFRLNDPDVYPEWYGEAHSAPELLETISCSACPSCSGRTSWEQRRSRLPAAT